MKAIALLLLVGSAGASPPEFELRPQYEYIDPTGNKHVVCDQLRYGVRVLGAEAILHDDRPNQVPDLSKVSFNDATPAIDAETARMSAAKAMADLNAKVTHASVELVYEKSGRSSHSLVYRVDLSLDPGETDKIEWRLWVDPYKGVVTRREEQSATVAVTGTSLRYGVVPLEGYFIPKDEDGPDRYTLEDRTRPAANEAITTTSRLDQYGNISSGNWFYSFDGHFGNGMDMKPADVTSIVRGPLSPTGQTSGVDAHYAAAWAWDLFTDIFQRHGPYGNGDGFRVIVHAVDAGLMYQRLGRIVWVPPGSDQCAAATELEPFAHEIGHAFFRNILTADGTKGEPAAIDEATGDIIGKLTGMYQQTKVGLPDTWANWKFWVCGNTGVLRHMDHPSLDGHSLDFAWPADLEHAAIDGHYLNGPINRMFYFLAQGVAKPGHPGESSPQFLPGGMQGIGVRAAADIYYRALVAHLLPRTNPGFLNLRAALFEAANSLAHKKAVQDAFAAVNIGPPADRTGPAISNVPALVAPGRKFKATVTPTAETNDDHRVTRVQYGTWGIATAEPWEITVPSNAVNGSHQLEICADDAYENRTCETFTVFVDALEPVISKFELPNPLAPINSRPVKLSAYDSPAPRKLASATIYMHESGAWLPLKLWETETTAASISVEPTIYIPPTVKEGTHVLGVDVADEAGNIATRTIPLVWDKTPPNVCEIASKAVYGSNTVELTVNGADALTGIGRLELYLDGNLKQYWDMEVEPGQVASRNATLQASYGDHTAMLVCRDRAGRPRTVEKGFKVKRPPSLSVTTMPYAWAGGRVTMTYRIYVTDSAGIASVYSRFVCSVSGVHDNNIRLPVSGNPTLYDQTFMKTGLVPGETCIRTITAYDIHNIEARDHRELVIPPEPACNARMFDQTDGTTIVFSVGRKNGYVDFDPYSWVDYDAFSVRCRDGGTINGASTFNTGCIKNTGQIGVPRPPPAKLSIACNSSFLELQVTPICFPGDEDDGIWSANFSCAY